MSDSALPAGTILDQLQGRDGGRRFAERTMALLEEIYPIARSITGNGVRLTLDVLEKHIPLVRHEVPTGTKAFDWEVPREWNVREAHIANPAGEKVVDFNRHPLHLVGYSTSVRARMPLQALRPHLFTLPDRPDWIPYRTSYWKETWGFCLTQRQLDALPDCEYDVVIDTTLEDGHLTYAECVMEGELSDEFLVFTHICHPALANDNASGLAMATLLAAELARTKTRLSYRFVFAPATIGSITWLSRNADTAKRVRGGLVLGLLGDAGPLTYKRSRRGNTEIDFIATRSVKTVDKLAKVVDYSPYGYDERQFCSPGFDLPIGRLTRSANGEYPEYHTSADNPQLMNVDALAASARALGRIVARMDRNNRLVRVDSRCEPRLGKHGLFRSTGGQSPREFEFALLWVLNQADGGHGALDIADASGIGDDTMASAAEALVKAGLIEDMDLRRARTDLSSGAAGYKSRTI